MSNRLSLIVVDVEADGPCPGLYSMVSFGAVCVDNLNEIFYGTTRPISKEYVPEALEVSGFSREQHCGFDDPAEVMSRFSKWIEKVCPSRAVFISDNPAFDWQFINYYFHKYLQKNPFGFSARRIGDIYSGLTKNIYSTNKWKRFRKTRHTHNPVDDAKGNAEALLEFNKMGLKF